MPDLRAPLMLLRQMAVDPRLKNNQFFGGTISTMPRSNRPSSTSALRTRASSTTPGERADLVARHQPTVTGNVGGEDRGEFALYRLDRHVWLLPSVVYRPERPEREFSSAERLAKGETEPDGPLLIAATDSGSRNERSVRVDLTPCPPPRRTAAIGAICSLPPIPAKFASPNR